MTRRLLAPIVVAVALLGVALATQTAGAATTQTAPAIQPEAPSIAASVPAGCNGGGWCPYSTTWASGRVSGTSCYVNGRLEFSHKFVAKWQSSACQSYTAKVTAYIYNSQSGQWVTTDSTLLLYTTTTRSVPQGYHICYVYIALYNAYGVFVGDVVYYRGVSGSNAYPYML